MKKMFFALSLVLASSAFAIITPPPTPTPWTGDCTDPANCNLTREASIDLYALRGGVDADLRICRIELNHDCPTCGTDDSIKVLGSNWSSVIANASGMDFAADHQPLKAILFLNSIKKGQTFSITFCSTVRRVVVGSAWSNASASFSGSLNVTAGAVGLFGQPFNGGLEIDGLRYKVEKMCGADTAWTQIGSTVALAQGQSSSSVPSVHIPALTSAGNGTFGTDVDNQAWRCLEGNCKFKVTFGEFDRCFRLLDDACRNAECKPTAMKLSVKATVNAEFQCLDNCDTN